MAEAVIWTPGDIQHSCSVCHGLLKNLLACNCGHSFCSSCLHECREQGGRIGGYRCPHCGDSFTPKPVLRRCIMIVDVLGRLKKAELSSSNRPKAPCYAGPGDVKCDDCSGRIYKAVKFCVTCVASFCETHVIPHTTVPSLKKHKLIEASSDVQENICLQHNKLNEFYCRTDQKCVCALCLLNEHKGHDTAEAVTERTEKQIQITEKQSEVQLKIQEKQNELEKLKQAVETLKCSSQNNEILTQLTFSIEKMCSEVAHLLRAQEQTEYSRAAASIKQLEQEITELHRRDTELKQLLNTDNNIYFLQHFHSLPSISVSEIENSSILTVSQHTELDDVKKSLADLGVELKKFDTEAYKIISNFENFQKRFSKEPITRDFLLYFCKFTLDPTTAHTELHIHEDNRGATCRETLRPYVEHPGRFDYWPQVLCKESLTERCYWEVEWKRGIWGVYIAVSYKEVETKGQDWVHRFGHNSQSWSLECSSTPCIWHNNNKTEISGPLSSKIGVYVDCKAGTLSFYNITETMTLLYRVMTTFTQPLYPGFWLSMSSSVRLCDL